MPVPLDLPPDDRSVGSVDPPEDTNRLIRAATALATAHNAHETRTDTLTTLVESGRLSEASLSGTLDARWRAVAATAGTDLDDLTVPGDRWIGSAIAADPENHTPVPQGGMLTVRTFVQGDSRYVVQQYTRADENAPKTFVRYRHATRGWGPWIDLTASTDLTPVLSELSTLAARVTALEQAEPPEPVDPYTVADMASSWWVEPLTVQHDGHVYVGGIGSTGSTGIADFDTATETAQRINLSTLSADDHNAPAMLVPDDEPPMVAYAQHNQEPYVRVRIGAAPGDVASLEAVEDTLVPVGATASYVLLVRRPGTRTVALITRTSGTGPTVFLSHDWGQTWTPPESAQLLAQNIYVTVRAAGDTLHIGMADHPTAVENIWFLYARVDLTTGALSNAAGTVLPGNLWETGTSPTTPLLARTGASGMTIARRELAADEGLPDWDGTNTSRLLDIGPGGSFAAVRLNMADAGQGGTYGVYRFQTTGATGAPSAVRPDDPGRGWTFEPIVHSGVALGFAASGYVGGMVFSGSDDSVVLCREEDGTWLLEQWASTGGTWSRTAEIASRTGGRKLGRPKVPAGPADVVAVVDYSHYDTSGYTSYAGRQLLLPLAA